MWATSELSRKVNVTGTRSHEPSSVTLAENTELLGIVCELSPLQTGTLP
ncbi:MAG: hypothetical protein F6K32_12115 [Desertifilum sp. SIO1I2]|nr:hypothetical protein [Desertifilum sp. SIO1I2]